MLVDVRQFTPDQLAILTSRLFGDRTKEGGTHFPERIDKGMYRITHFNLDMWIRNILVDSWPEFAEMISPLNGPDCTFYSHGVVDTPEQLMELAPFIELDLRQFVVSFTSIKKSEQESSGGWRWHKWGPYIGKHFPKCEYLYDEPDIEEVFVYHIYEVDQ